MASLDIFKQDAFSTIQMLSAIEKVDYQPQFLGTLNLFEPEPLIGTDQIMIEERDSTLSLIQTSERGAPLAQRTTEKRKVRSFMTSRIAKKDRLMASELFRIRAFGSETELMQVQREVARRLAGPAGLMRDVELTWENMRLGAVQGIVTDADGSTIVNFFTEFGVAQPAEVALDLANTADGALKQKITAIVRAMQRAAKGVWTPQTRIVGLCGDAFYDEFTNHAEVRNTYKNWTAAADLRKGAEWNTPFPYGGVDWINYRGTDDTSTVAVNTDRAKFFPVNAPGAFKVAWAPGEFFDTIAMPGQPVYPKVIVDDERQAWADIEVYSYPLFLCTRPAMLQRAKRGA
jgi:hypothetical protein